MLSSCKHPRTEQTLVPQKIRTRNGFTLMELMIVIAVAGILATLAAPNFNELLKNNRLTNKTNDLVVSLGIARQIAVSRSLVTFICHSNNAETASPTCNGGTGSGWEEGFIIYTAPPRTIVNSQRDYNSSNDILIQQSNLEGDDMTVTVVSGNASDYISFASSGLLFDNTAVKLKLCDDRNIGRIVNVSRSGSISSDVAEGADICS